MESNSKLESLPRSSSLNSNSTLNSDLIEEPVGDVFFDVAKNYVIKKLELEELKEELESAEYQEAYQEVDNIYEDRSDPISFEDINLSPDTSDDILLKIKEKKGQITATETEYAEKKNANQSNPKYSNIILFVDTLNLYVSNKEGLSSIIKGIHEEVQKGIKIGDKLGNIEATDSERQDKKVKKNYLIENWEPNFSSYEIINKNLRKLFNSIYDDKILNENDKLYKILSTHKLFNTDGLFYKAIYDSEELTSLFDRLHKNVFEILKDYTRYNEYVKSIINPRTSVGNGVFGKYKKDNDKLQEEILRLNRELSQIKRNDDLPKSREKKRQQLRRLSKLDQEGKKRLNEKMNLQIQKLKTKHQADVDELNKEIEQLRSRSTQTTSAQSIDIEAKSTEAQYIEELNKRTEVLTEQLAKKIAELTDAQKLVDTPKEEIDAELTLLESKEDPNEFLSLVIKSADLYGKPEFKASFEELLKYQPKEEKPEDKFMFAYVFNEIETNKTDYDYLEDFLKQYTIPDQTDTLITQIMETSFKPAPQTHL